MSRHRHGRQPTLVSQVERVLQKLKDEGAELVTTRTLRQLLPDMLGTQLSAALYHLRSRRCADYVQDSTGIYWFYTPETDTRQEVHEERVPETKPRRARRSRRHAPHVQGEAS